MVWLFLFLGTILVQIANVWAIKEFDANNGLFSALKIAMITLPATFLATACFSCFYGISGKTYNYPMIAISAYGFSLMVSTLSQYLFLESKQYTWVDIVAMVMVVIGLLLSVFKSNILAITKF